MAERPLNDRGLPHGYPLQADWEVTPRDVRALQTAGEDFVLLDVREPHEITTARLPGTVCVPMGEVKSRLSDLDEHAEDKVIVVCHHGARSMQVTAFLRQHGFDDVRSMAGGIDLWSRDIDPQVPRY